MLPTLNAAFVALGFVPGLPFVLGIVGSTMNEVLFTASKTTKAKSCAEKAAKKEAKKRKDLRTLTDLRNGSIGLIKKEDALWYGNGMLQACEDFLQTNSCLDNMV